MPDLEQSHDLPLLSYPMLSGVADKKGCLCLFSATQSNLEEFLAHGLEILLCMSQAMSHSVQQNAVHSTSNTWLKNCWIKYQNFWKKMKTKIFIKPVPHTNKLVILSKMDCNIFWTQNKHSMLTISKQAITFACWLIQMYLNGLHGLCRAMSLRLQYWN